LAAVVVIWVQVEPLVERSTSNPVSLLLLSVQVRLICDDDRGRGQVVGAAGVTPPPV
jgi:hypothetical protein